MHKNSSLTRIFILGISALLFLCTVIAIIIFHNSTVKQIQDNTYRILENSAQEQATSFRGVLEGKFLALETFANAITDDKNDTIEKMKKTLKIGGFHDIAYVEPNGDSFFYDGRKSNIAESQYFIKSMKGNRAVKYIKNNKAIPDSLLVLSVPTIRKNEVVGVITASFNEKQIRNYLVSKAYERNGYYFICDKKGNVIVGNDNNNSLIPSQVGNNVLDLLEKSLLDEEFSVKRVVSDLSNEKSGVVAYNVDGRRRYAVYQPININSWVIFSVVPGSIADAHVLKVKKNGFILFGIIIAVAAMLLLTVIMLEKIQRQQLETDRIALSNANKELAYSAERMKIALQSNSVTIWDYDIIQKRIIQDKRNKEIYGFDTIIENVPESLIESGFIHSDSAAEFLTLHNKLLSGEKTAEGIFKVQTADRKSFWYKRIRYTNTFDEKGNPYKAIGTSENVDELYEMKMAYNHTQEMFKSFLQNCIFHHQYNLTKNILVKDFEENKTSIFPKELVGSNFQSAVNYFVENFVYVEDQERYRNFLNREHFIEGYGNRSYEDNLDFRILSDNLPVWFRAIVHIVEEPFSKDIMLYIFYYNIDEKKAKELQVRYEAHKDDLTGLLNRRGFMSQITSILAEFPRNRHAFLMIDLDGFKQINDSLGHLLGDELLIGVASDIKSMLREEDSICRLGGDEFIICLKKIENEDIAIERADNILQKLQRKINGNLSLTASIGIAFYPRDGKNFGELYRKSDIALYAAKKYGKNCYFLYDKKLEKNIYVPRVFSAK